jgi:DNA repair protein RecO (recombination protein O)
MRHKLNGIVLNYIRYSESSIISNIYTEQFGLQGYIVNNVRSSKPKYNIAFFQPLTQLEFVGYHNYTGKLNRVTEIRISHAYSDIPFNVRKSTVAMFLSEVLLKTLQEETANPELFEFVSSSFTKYDQLKKNFQNFHIQFLFRYLKFIGLEPSAIEHLFETDKGERPYAFIDSELIDHLLRDPYGADSSITHTQRRDLVEMLVSFITRNLHIDNNLKSLQVLKEVFE